MTHHPSPSFKDPYQILELLALKETDDDISLKAKPNPIITESWNFLRIKNYFKRKIECVLKSGWIQNLQRWQD